MKGVKTTFWVSTILNGLFIIPGVFFLTALFHWKKPMIISYWSHHRLNKVF